MSRPGGLDGERRHARHDGPPVGVALRIDDLTVRYRRRPALEHLSGAFDVGSLTAVVGPNGAGKTSLMRVLAGEPMETTGTVDLAPRLRGRVAYLPQRASLDIAFPMRVGDVVMLGHWLRLGAFRRASAAMHDEAAAALAAVGLEGFEPRLLEELSTGQLQRVRFARAVLQDAHLILLDEPFAGVDARTTDALIAVLLRWHAEGRTVVAVLHDLDQVRRHFPATLLIAREQVAWGPTAEVLRPKNLDLARRSSVFWDEGAEAGSADRVPDLTGAGE